jgi:hypothetical protein
VNVPILDHGQSHNLVILIPYGYLSLAIGEDFAAQLFDFPDGPPLNPFIHRQVKHLNPGANLGCLAGWVLA